MASPKIVGISIVLRGSLNPAIFHPEWFGRHELLKPEETAAADVQIVHREVSAFKLDWMQVQVTPDRFHATSMQEAYFPSVRDFVLGTLRVLHHTPISLVGLNTNVHYAMPSEAAWHELGFLLAPKEPWTKVFASEQRPGLRSLIIEGQRNDAWKGFIRLKVEPSTEVPLGLFVNVNDHYDLGSEINGAENAIQILDEKWTESLEWSRRSADYVAELV